MDKPDIAAQFAKRPDSNCARWRPVGARAQAIEAIVDEFLRSNPQRSREAE